MSNSELYQVFRGTKKGQANSSTSKKQAGNSELTAIFRANTPRSSANQPSQNTPRHQSETLEASLRKTEQTRLDSAVTEAQKLYDDYIKRSTQIAQQSRWGGTEKVDREEGRKLKAAINTAKQAAKAYRDETTIYNAYNTAMQYEDKKSEKSDADIAKATNLGLPVKKDKTLFGWEATEAQRRQKQGEDVWKIESLQNLSDEELDVYNRLSKNGKEKEAEEFLEALTPYLNARVTASRLDDAEKRAQNNPVAAALASSLLKPVTAIPSGAKVIGDGVKTIFGGADGDVIDPNDPIYFANHLANKLRGTVASQIEQGVYESTLNDYRYDRFGNRIMTTEAEARNNGKIAAFLFQTGMSMADMGMAMPFGPVGMKVIMTSNSAVDAMLDAKANGATDEQALAMGAVSGAAEAVFEKFSIGNLFSGKITSSMIMSSLKQAGIEASEELATEVANVLANEAIMGENSNFHIAVDEYEKMGLNTEEAQKKAFNELLLQVGLAGLGGGLSGFAMGGVSDYLRTSTAGRNAVDTYLSNEFVNKNKIADYITKAQQEYSKKYKKEGMSDAEVEKAVKDSADKIEELAKTRQGEDSKQYLSDKKNRKEAEAALLEMYRDESRKGVAGKVAKNKGSLGRQVMANVDADIDEAVNAAKEKMKAEGMTDDQIKSKAKEFANDLRRIADNAQYASTIEERKAWTEKYSSMLNATDIESVDVEAETETTEAEPTKAAKKVEKLRDRLDAEYKKLDALGEKGKRSYEATVRRDAIRRIKKELAEWEAQLDTEQKAESIKAEGLPKSVKDVDPLTARWKNNAPIFIPKAEAPLVSQQYDSAQKQIEQITSDVYELRKQRAETDNAEEKARLKKEIDDLLSQQRDITIKTGITAPLSGKPMPGVKVTDQKGKRGTVKNTPKSDKPGVIRDFSRTLSKEQEKSIGLLNAFAESVGRTIHIVENISVNKVTKEAQYNISFKGEYAKGDTNGLFDPNTNEYYISLNSIGEAYAFVAMHESVHDIAVNATEAYTQLKDIVFEELEKNSQDVKQLVRDQMDRYGYSEDIAIEEVLANTVPAILRDQKTADELVNRILDSSAETKNVFMRMLDQLKQYFQKAYDTLVGRKDWKQMEAISKDMEAVDRIREKYLEGLEAIKNTETQQGGEIRNAVIDLGDGRKYVEADKEGIFGDDPKKWPGEITNYINQQIRQGKDVTVYAIDGDALTITRDSAGKAQFRNKVNLPNGQSREMTDAEYAVKLRAEAHIDELAEVSRRGKKIVPDKKNHPFAKDGFNYRTAFFKDETGYYRITISVGKNGKINTVYNVGKIKEAEFPRLFVAQRPEKNSTSHRTSILEPDRNVNLNLSAKDGENNIVEERAENADEPEVRTLTESAPKEPKIRYPMRYDIPEGANIKITAKGRDGLEQADIDAFNRRHSIPAEPANTNQYTTNHVPPNIKVELQNKKRIEREYQEYVNSTNLTEEEMKTLDSLYKGGFTQEEAVKAAQTKHNNINAQQAADYYAMYEKLMQNRNAVSDYNRKRKGALFDEAQALTEGAINWQDKKTGIQYARETMERNNFDIMSHEEAEAINKHYFTPVHENEANNTRWKKKFADRMRSLNLNKWESKYVHALINEKDLVENRMGKSGAEEALSYTRQAMDKLRKSHGQLIDVKKCRNAVPKVLDIFREIYGDLADAEIRNGYAATEFYNTYAPNIQDDSNLGIFERIAQSLGFEQGDMRLPTDLAGLTANFKPGKPWFQYSLSRHNHMTAFDIHKAFDQYIRGAGNVVWHTDDIQRLRALETAIRYQFSEEGIRKQIAEVLKDDTLDPDEQFEKIQRLSQSNKNLGNYVTNLTEYTNLLAGKKSMHDRGVETDLGRAMYRIMNNVQGRIAGNVIGGNLSVALSNFIPLTQALSGVRADSLALAFLESGISLAKDDGFDNRSTFITNRMGVDGLYRDFTGKVNDALSMPFNLLDRMVTSTLVRARYAENVQRGMSEDEAMLNADTWAASLMADRSKGALPTIFGRTNPLAKLFNMFQVEANNQLSYMAKDVARDVKELNPTASPGKVATFVAARLFAMFMAAFGYNKLREYVGLSANAFDPISWIEEVFGEVEKHKEGEQTTYDTVKNITASTADQIPFVGSFLGGEGRYSVVQSALPDVGNIMQAYELDEANGAEGKYFKSVLKKELEKPVFYYLLPTAGGQIKKTRDGIITVAKGGSESVNKKGETILQYPVEQTAGKYVKAAILGKSSLPEAQAWVESGFESLSPKQTEMYREYEGAGGETMKFIDYQKRYDELTKEASKVNAEINEKYKEIAAANPMLTDAEAKERAQKILGKTYRNAENEFMLEIQNSDMTDLQKLAAMTAIGFNDEEIDTVRGLMNNGISVSDYIKYDNFYRERGSTLTEDKNALVSELMSDKSLSEAQKTMLANKLIDGDWIVDFSSQEANDILTQYGKSSYNSYRKARDEANLTAAAYLDYLNNEEKFVSDYDKYGKSISNSKKAKIVNYLDSLDLTEAQKEWMYRELFGYSSKYANRYSKLKKIDGVWHYQTGGKWIKANY